MIPSSFLLATALLVLASGCRCADDSSSPYTPFGVVSAQGGATTTSSASPSASVEATRRFEQRTATRNNPAAKTIQLDGKEWRAPDGHLIALGLSLGSNAEQALLWLVPEAPRPSAPPGSLWRTGLEEAPTKLSDFPAFVPTLAGCTHAVRLDQTGPETVTLDIAAQCEQGAVGSRVPVRSLQVLNWAGAPQKQKLLGLRFADPPRGESLELAIDSQDIDGDTHDDVRLRVTIEAEGDPHEASAEVIWLERVAGPARKDNEPAQSFTEIGSVEVVRSRGTNTSAHVSSRVRNARRLFSYLCAESGSYGVTNEEGSPIECGDLSAAFGWYVLAEVQAGLEQQLLGNALSAFERRSWYGTPNQDAVTRAESALRKAMGHRSVTYRMLDVRAREPDPSPRFAPLAFTSDGSLLIQGGRSLFRYDHGEVQDASEEVDPWPLTVQAPDGQVLLGFVYPCDSSTVLLQGRTPDGRYTQVDQTEWSSPRPGMCRGEPDFTPLDVRPVAWLRQGFAGVIGSSWFGPSSALAAPRLGSPVSPNGKHWVAATSLGVFVQHEADAELWTARKGGANEPGAGDLSECVIDNQGQQVACLVDAEVILLQKGSPSQDHPATNSP